MKLTVERRSIYVTPEHPTDVAYIEEVLGLKEDGQGVRLVRKNAMRSISIAYLRADGPEAKAEQVLAPGPGGTTDEIKDALPKSMEDLQTHHYVPQAASTWPFTTTCYLCGLGAHYHPRSGANPVGYSDGRLD